MKLIKKFIGTNILSHPAYSSELVQSDSYLFGPPKDALRGNRFSNNKEVKKMMQNWLQGQSKDFFARGSKKLQKRWDKCVNVGGDYVAK